MSFYSLCRCAFVCYCVCNGRGVTFDSRLKFVKGDLITIWISSFASYQFASYSSIFNYLSMFIYRYLKLKLKLRLKYQKLLDRGLIFFYILFLYIRGVGNRLNTIHQSINRDISVINLLCKEHRGQREPLLLSLVDSVASSVGEVRTVYIIFYVISYIFFVQITSIECDGLLDCYLVFEDVVWRYCVVSCDSMAPMIRESGRGWL